uniref:Uncharacterized protein n=1 Tax=Anguilla anguilla TaxID=7936 RepID=A0A0E9QEV6_ANGAN
MNLNINSYIFGNYYAVNERSMFIVLIR